jgi:hypothetical protein
MRKYLLQPIPEINLGVKLLDAAADVLINGGKILEAKLIAYAGFPEIIEYAVRVLGKMSEDVHRQIIRPALGVFLRCYF